MTTRWSPDTCSCVVEYDENMVHVATISACPKHAALAHSSAHLDAVLAHNRAKNAAAQWLSDLGVQPLSVHYDPHARGPDPVIVMVPKEAAVTQTHADAMFGAGKVRISMVDGVSASAPRKR